MNDNFLFINNKKVFFDKNITLIQACSKAGIEIPRFCYHERLSIAGNCRMCLVEVEKAPKPMASCALPVVKGMKIFTNTTLVKKAREGILEFLLANHPLDCPICDQGGECDLQDQSIIFGGDRGRFYEQKRAVEDKECGPLIKTLMTRCIHCTRCIRFSSEIIGTSFLGTTGRGLHMEVGSYLDNVFTSELSGNVIDLCPVGALTSKPYSFTARPWDLNSIESIDIFDSLNSNIFFNYQGSNILRVLPSLNENVNEEWISDKIRFSFDGLKIQRLSFPLIKNSKGFVNVSWVFVLSFLKKLLILKNREKFKVRGFFGPLVDAESIYSFKKFLSIFSNNQVFSFLKNNYNFSSADFRSNYLFNTSLKNLNKKESIVLLVGVDFAKESPVLKSRLNKIFSENNSLVFNLGCSNLKFNYKVRNLGNSYNVLFEIIKGNHWLCNLILQNKNIDFIFSENIFSFTKDINLKNYLLFFFEKLKKVYHKNVSYNFFNLYSSTINSFELGLVNDKIFSRIENSFNKDFFNLDFVLQSELDFNLNSDFLIFQGHHGNSFVEKSNIILPGCSFVEKDAFFLNFEGRVQKARKVISPLYDSRIDWSIFFSILNFIGFKNFNFSNLKSLRLELFKYSILFKSFKNLKKKNKNLIYKKKIVLNMKKQFFSSFINNFYFTDSISKNSDTMVSCFKEINSKNLNFNKV
jgi:NADH-quinone oxidoreductase subunit G